jgi:histidinol dehydrogenase
MSGRESSVEDAVREIIGRIRDEGDRALFDYAQRFDKSALTAKNVRISPEEIKQTAAKADSGMKKTIREAAKRIKAYHSQQRRSGFSMRSEEGKLEFMLLPLGRAGLCVPGGYTSYPSSILMCAIPAQVAGVKEIAVITPGRRELDASMAYAFSLLGIDEVYRVGGAHAVAALAYGTKSVRRVDKIVGPGGAFVATAKKLVYGAVDIDSIAGPSEVTILADDSANPEWIALDLLSQAEHGTGDERAQLVCESEKLARSVLKHLETEIAASQVKEVFDRLARGALSICVCQTREQSIRIINEIAPEHLEIMTESPRKDLKEIRNASAVFLGQYSPVATGDYFIGTNHVLPTGTAARYASPLGVDDFMKRISVATVTKSGLRGAAEHVSRFARAENFVHHAISVERRVQGS